MVTDVHFMVFSFLLTHLVKSFLLLLLIYNILWPTAEEESDVCVRDRALLYYRLLQRGVEETRKVVTGPKSDPSMSVLTGRQEEPISDWASTFNTLSPLAGRDLCPQTAVTSAADQPSSSAEKQLLPGKADLFSLHNFFMIFILCFKYKT